MILYQQGGKTGWPIIDDIGSRSYQGGGALRRLVKQITLAGKAGLKRFDDVQKSGTVLSDDLRRHRAKRVINENADGYDAYLYGVGEDLDPSAVNNAYYGVLDEPWMGSQWRGAGDMADEKYIDFLQSGQLPKPIKKKR